MNSINLNTPECKVVIDIPQNEPLEVWYPREFNQSNVPLFPAHHKCEYQIKTRDGWSSRVLLTVINPGKHSPVRVIDEFGKTEHVFNTSEEHFYFNNKDGLIKVHSGNHKMHFGFKVDWVETEIMETSLFDSFIDFLFSYIGYKVQYRVNETDVFPIQSWITTSRTFFVRSESRVSMTVVASSTLMDRQLMRSVYVYDGIDIKCRCIGTAYDLWKKKSQYVSSGNYMKIQFLSRDIKSYRQMLFFQDYENTKHITRFEGIICRTGHNCGIIEMDARNGPVAIQTVSDRIYSEKDIVTSYEGDGYLEVHIGGVKKDKNNIFGIFESTIKSEDLVPQSFVSPIKTYVLNNGTAKLNITRNWDEFKKTRKLGRMGFITSNFYGMSKSRQQSANEDILAPEGVSNAKFSYRIQYLRLNRLADCRIVGYKNDSIVYEKIMDTSISTAKLDKNQFPERYENEFYGDKMTVDFDGGGLESAGLFLTFYIV